MNHSRNFFQVIRLFLTGLSALAAALCVTISQAQEGRATYDKTCATCHAKGVAGAPQSNDSAELDGSTNR